jgi:Caspase domain
MSEKRIALVIGNSHYTDGEISGVEDAKAMTKCLKAVGFTLPPGFVILDGTLDQIKSALDGFQNEIADAAVVVFYYSGHGFQLQQLNFLLPVDGSISQAGAVAVDTIIQRLAAAPDAVKFVILDACRDQKNLSPDVLKGLANPGPAVQGVIQCFAASPGQSAPSGSADGLSPYSAALLRYLPQAGLALNDLFAKVHSVVELTQEPVFVTTGLPNDFFFRDPVTVHAVIPGGHSDLLVFLRGEVVLDTDQPMTKDFLLNAGDNELALFVSNGRVHRNNHDWDITEGWSYRVDLGLPDGSMTTFEGAEDIPFKDGPHFGKVFQVAQVDLHVDEQTADLTMIGLDNDIADRQAPLFAQNQGVLFRQSIADLNLSPEDILSSAIDLGDAAAILQPFLVELLKSGTIFGVTIADPANTFVTVLGNLALKDFAAGCMANRDDRIKDLKASIAAVFNRNPTPFAAFDQGLTACMRAAAQSRGSALQPDDIQVWTALEDDSQASPATAVVPTLAIAQPS